MDAGAFFTSRDAVRPRTAGRSLPTSSPTEGRSGRGQISDTNCRGRSAIASRSHAVVTSATSRDPDQRSRSAPGWIARERPGTRLSWSSRLGRERAESRHPVKALEQNHQIAPAALRRLQGLGFEQAAGMEREASCLVCGVLIVVVVALAIGRFGIASITSHPWPACREIGRMAVGARPADVLSSSGRAAALARSASWDRPERGHIGAPTACPGNQLADNLAGWRSCPAAPDVLSRSGWRGRNRGWLPPRVAAMDPVRALRGG
jgi:hypothetical protein